MVGVSTLLAVAGGASAQTKRPPIVIGWFNSESRTRRLNLLRAFEEGLTALGWMRDQNIMIEEFWADGKIDRLPSLAQQLAEKKPAVILASPFQAVSAAAKAAPETPVVIGLGSDPVAAGFAKSLARPGGMITGLSNVNVQTSEKYLELLLSAMPNLKKVGLLFDPTAVPATPANKEHARRALSRYAIEGISRDAAEPEQIEPAIAQLAKAGVQALIVFPSGFFGSERTRILTVARVHRLPVVAGSADFANDGGLFSYGADSAALFRRAAYYVDRILKGAKPGELPIEQPTTFEMVVNMKTAEALGITIPQSVLLQASRVIE